MFRGTAQKHIEAQPPGGPCVETENTDTDQYTPAPSAPPAPEKNTARNILITLTTLYLPQPDQLALPLILKQNQHT